MEKLLKETLGLNINNIPKAGRTITTEEYIHLMLTLDNIIRPKGGIKLEDSIVNKSK